MTFNDFFRKLTGRYLWGNLLAMGLTVILLFIGLFFFLNYYTQHGKTITVPAIRGQRSIVAVRRLEALGLHAEVVDTGYNPRIAADIILDQDLRPGEKIKAGRLLLLTVNAADPRPVALPDIADNSSLREARMRLEVLGFRLNPVKRIRGDKDWVYRVEAAGREVHTGERLNVNIPLTLVVGDGSEEEIFNGDDSLDNLYFNNDTTFLHEQTE